MTVQRYCRQCGERVAMEVKSQKSSRRFCDKCRRERAVQATLRNRRRNLAAKGYSEIHRVRFDYTPDGVVCGMEVLE